MRRVVTDEGYVSGIQTYMHTGTSKVNKVKMSVEKKLLTGELETAGDEKHHEFRETCLSTCLRVRAIVRPVELTMAFVVFHRLRP